MGVTYHQATMVNMDAKDQAGMYNVDSKDLVGRSPGSPPPKVKDNVVWSLFNFVYMSPLCCCTIWALLFSIRSRDRLHAGDVEAARLYGRKAWRVNVIVTTIFVVLLLTYISYIIYMRVYINQAVNRAKTG